MPRKKSTEQPTPTPTPGGTLDDISHLTADLVGKIKLCKGKSGDEISSADLTQVFDNVTEIVHFLNPQMSYDELRLVTWEEGVDIRAGMALLHTVCARSESPQQKTTEYTMLGISVACNSTEKAVDSLLAIMQRRAGDFMPGIIAAAPLGMPFLAQLSPKF